MRNFVQRLLSGRPDQPAAGRPRLSFETLPSTLYAIGDVHGCLHLLKELEQAILADSTEVIGEKWIIMLGDYVDRGERSAQVLDHLLRPPPAGFKRICLCGNHEDVMLGFLRDPSSHEEWLTFGGDATLGSYGIDLDALGRVGHRSRQFRNLLGSYVPTEHTDFLAQLPSMLVLPGLIFVHAGLRPGVPLSEQSDEDLLWIRNEFFDAEHSFGATVVHGHTPVPKPVLTLKHINLDTGAYATGRLTALRINSDGTTRLMVTGD